MESLLLQCTEQFPKGLKELISFPNHLQALAAIQLIQ